MMTEDVGTDLEVGSERLKETTSLVERAMAMAVAQSKDPDKSCIAVATLPALSKR